jgi:uncharacterized protein (TIGR03437 family)
MIFALLVLAGPHLAQQAGIATVAQPQVFGSEVFDSIGNLYAMGNGPVTAGAVQTQNGGGTCLFSNGFFDTPGPCTDAYVGRIDASGKLIFGTYLGGPTNDLTTALAIDASGNVYMTGTTGGYFPTTPYAAIATSTTAVDEQGNAYISGGSSTGHAFVVKVSGDGSSILYNTPLAGKGIDSAMAMASDAGGFVVVAGRTTSPDFPVTPGTLQNGLRGAQNAFVSKLDPGGHVLFSTLLGGSGLDYPTALQTDATGGIYLTGYTSSLDFPTTAGALQPTPIVPLWNISAPAGFATKLSADGSAIAWSTYVMSMDRAQQNGVYQTGSVTLALSPGGDAYVTGLSGVGFPITPSAPQACLAGPYADVFVAHLNGQGALADATYVGPAGSGAHALTLAQDGSVLLAWTNASQAVRSQIRFGGVAAACLSPAISNSATLAGQTFVVPGQLVTLSGYGLGSNVQVLFDGKPAPVSYAGSSQINVQAPVELSGKTQTTITVSDNRTTYPPISTSVMPFGAPGIFRLQGGLSTQAVAINQDGTLNGPSNPAPKSSVVTVWGTGFGLTSPSCRTGAMNPSIAANLAPGLSAAFNTPSAPANVFDIPPQYAGNAPGLPCGVIQINMQVPSYAPTGLYQFSFASLMDAPGGGQYVQQSLISDTIQVK